EAVCGVVFIPCAAAGEWHPICGSRAGSQHPEIGRSAQAIRLELQTQLAGGIGRLTLRNRGHSRVAQERLTTRELYADRESLHGGTWGAHDHPVAAALLEEIHPNEVTAGVLSVAGSLF